MVGSGLVCFGFLEGRIDELETSLLRYSRVVVDCSMVNDQDE
jgi:hypothetical protein